MTTIVTAVELARRVGVDPKTFRAWLRKQGRAGNPLVEGHLRHERWEFSLDEAEELAGQFRHRGTPSQADMHRSSAATETARSVYPDAEPESDPIRDLSVEGLALPGPDAAPDSPGLYSVSAAVEQALADLGLEDVEGETSLLVRVLYLGKAEDSLRGRLAGTHFKTGKTGWSTLRRTLAALLDLQSCPRPSRIEAPTPEQLQTMTSNYGLLPDDETKLTTWMIENLEVRAAETGSEPLPQLERTVGVVLRPPLDQERTPLWSPNPWRVQVADARARLRVRAREVASHLDV